MTADSSWTLGLRQPLYAAWGNNKPSNDLLLYYDKEYMYTIFIKELKQVWEAPISKMKPQD